jgi:hypothetical protein
MGREEEMDDDYYNQLVKKYYGTLYACPFPQHITSIKQTFLDLIITNCNFLISQR